MGFQNLRYIGQGSYIVQRYGKPLSSEVKYITEDLYLLPSKLLPCELVDKKLTLSQSIPLPNY